MSRNTISFEVHFPENLRNSCSFMRTFLCHFDSVLSYTPKLRLNHLLEFIQNSTHCLTGFEVPLSRADVVGVVCHWAVTPLALASFSGCSTDGDRQDRLALEEEGVLPPLVAVTAHTRTHTHIHTHIEQRHTHTGRKRGGERERKR